MLGLWETKEWGASNKDDAVEQMNLFTPLSLQLVQMQIGPLRWMGKFRVFQLLENKAASKLQGGFLLLSGQVLLFTVKRNRSVFIHDLETQ